MENYKMVTDLNGKEVTVTYRIEPAGDLDDHTQAFIESIQTELGEEIQNDPEFDLEFECNQHFHDLQWQHYLKTGETL